MQDKNTEIANNLKMQIHNIDQDDELFQILIQNDIEKEVRINCSKVAEGVLYKLFIPKENRDLVVLLESSNSDRNNLDAVAEWIYKRNPELREANLETIRTYHNDLEEYLDELRN